MLPVVLLKRSLSTRETRRVLISRGQVFLMLQTAIVLVKWHWKLVWKVCIILINLLLQTLSNLILPKRRQVEWLINILVKPLNDIFTSDVSNKLDPSHHGGQIAFTMVSNKHVFISRCLWSNKSIIWRSWHPQSNW